MPAAVTTKPAMIGGRWACRQASRSAAAEVARTPMVAGVSITRWNATLTSLRQDRMLEEAATGTRDPHSRRLRACRSEAGTTRPGSAQSRAGRRGRIGVPPRGQCRELSVSRWVLTGC